MNTTAKPISYISTITDVREVALRLTADLDYWREQLRSRSLAPYDDNGRASLLLTAIEARFRGIRFRELSISVVVDVAGEATPLTTDDTSLFQGAYLAQAYNTSRLLAAAERVFFQTPYYPAELTLEERVPLSITVSAAGQTPFSARMGQETAGRRVDERFEGPIFLPDGDKVFYARLTGAGYAYPFTTADEVEIQATASAPIFSQLLESGCVGQEWLMRVGAIHARSKTYRRDAANEPSAL